MQSMEDENWDTRTDEICECIEAKADVASCIIIFESAFPLKDEYVTLVQSVLKYDQKGRRELEKVYLDM